MVSTFYAALGSLFYLRYSRDFEMGAANDFFYTRKLAKLHKKNNFDPLKVDFLKVYAEELREQLSVLQNIEKQ